jgi:hypothetical protein
MALGATAMVGYMSEGTAGFMGGAMQPMSRGTVESRLMNGVVTYASAAYWNHRLYVTYRQSSDTASIRVLVYDEHPAEQAPGTWTEDLLPAAAEGWNVYDNGTLSPILLYFDNAGHVYLHEDPTETGDLGSAIPVEITSRVITLGPQQGLWVRQVGIICDDCGSGVSANLTLTYQRTGLAAYWNAANSNALSLYGSGNPQVWRRTADAPAFAGSTYYDYGAQLDLRASLPPGTRILSLYAAVETRANGEDQL